MFGGIAVAKNTLCLAHSDARGRIVLVDLEECRTLSCWDYGPEGDYADAGGVAIAPDFSIYVADTRNDVVRRFTAFGREVGRLGGPMPRPTGAACRDRAGVLDRPRAVAICNGVVFVACGERKLLRGVQRFTITGELLPPLRAFGEDDRRFGAPRGVWAGPCGLLVADTLHGVVQRFTSSGRFIGHFATAARAEDSSRPVAVVGLADGEVLVVNDGARRALRCFAADGTPRSSDPPPEIQDPVGVAADERGRIYVLDQHGHRVVRLRADLAFDTVIVDLAEIVP